MNRELHTVSEAVEELGGNSAVGELLGVGSTAVSNWRSSDLFPTNTYKVIVEELGSRGCTIGMHLFAFREKRRSA